MTVYKYTCYNLARLLESVSAILVSNLNLSVKRKLLRNRLSTRDHLADYAVFFWRGGRCSKECERDGKLRRKTGMIATVENGEVRTEQTTDLFQNLFLFCLKLFSFTGYVFLENQTHYSNVDISL